MRNQRELGDDTAADDTAEVARPDMSAAPAARAGEEATLRAQDKRDKRPSSKGHATKQLHDGSTLERPIDSTAPVEQPRERALAERTG